MQTIRLTLKGVVVTLPNQKLFIENTVDAERLSKAAKVPIYTMPDLNEEEDHFKRSLWM